MTKKDEKNIKSKGYTAEQITVLEGLEPVRKRPGMYIGSTGQEGLHHLVTEIVNNSMDEAIAGFATHVKIEFFKDNSVAVYDNGNLCAVLCHCHTDSCPKSTGSTRHNGYSIQKSHHL